MGGSGAALELSTASPNARLHDGWIHAVAGWLAGGNVHSDAGSGILSAPGSPRSRRNGGDMSHTAPGVHIPAPCLGLRSAGADARAIALRQSILRHERS